MSALPSVAIAVLLASACARSRAVEPVASGSVVADADELRADDGARLDPNRTSIGVAFTRETIVRRLPDGIPMTADLWRSFRDPKASVALPGDHPLLVCLHASRSSRGEYARIAPELASRGFDVLAVDLRSGGEGEQGDRRTKRRSGTMNETWKAARERLGREPTQLEAYADFPAIVAWARELALPGQPVALVGSSYSASLAMVYAAEHPKDVDAVFAFSPGEWIAGWDVASKVKGLATPCFVTCGANDVDVEQMERVVRGMEHAPDLYSPKSEGRNGLHGAGTLHIKGDEDRAAVWKRFDAALERMRARARR